MAKISNINLQRNILAPAKDKTYLYLPWLHKRPKQKNFVLNCDAQDWKLPEYNSLYDENLTFFFANPKIRSILVKNGVVDENGNIDKTQTKSNFRGSKRYSSKYKLPPIPDDRNLAIQRIIIPYKGARQELVNPKLSKYQSAPQKRISSVGDSVVRPKINQSQTMKPQSLAQIRKVKPLSKDELQQVFAKYEVKTVKNGLNKEDEEKIIEERSTDCKDNKSESSPLETKEEEAQEEEKEPMKGPTSKKLDFDLHEEEVANDVAEPIVNLDEKEVEEEEENVTAIEKVKEVANKEKEEEFENKGIEKNNQQEELVEMEPEIDIKENKEENEEVLETLTKELEPEHMDLENSKDNEPVEENLEVSNDEAEVELKKKESDEEYNFSDHSENEFLEEEKAFEEV